MSTLAEMRQRVAAKGSPRDDDSPMQPIEDRRELLARLDKAIAQIEYMRDVRDCWNTTALHQIAGALKEIRK